MWPLKFALSEKLMKLNTNLLHWHWDAILNVTQFTPLVFPQKWRCVSQKETRSVSLSRVIQTQSILTCMKRSPTLRRGLGGNPKWARTLLCLASSFTILERERKNSLKNVSYLGFLSRVCTIPTSTETQRSPLLVALPSEKSVSQAALYEDRKYLPANYADFVHMKSRKYVIIF